MPEYPAGPSGTSGQGIAIPTRGLASARPAASTAGQSYYATDTSILSISTTGASWDDSVGGGGGAAPSFWTTVKWGTD